MSNNEVKKPDHTTNGILRILGNVAVAGISVAAFLLGRKK